MYIRININSIKYYEYTLEVGSIKMYENFKICYKNIIYSEYLFYRDFPKRIAYRYEKLSKLPKTVTISDIKYDILLKKVPRDIASYILTFDNAQMNLICIKTHLIKKQLFLYGANNNEIIIKFWKRLIHLNCVIKDEYKFYQSFIIINCKTGCKKIGHEFMNYKKNKSYSIFIHKN